MGVRDLWHRSLVYFGLAEDEAYYDDDEEATAAQSDVERSYRERPNVRRIERRPRRSVESDEMFDEPPAEPSRRRRHSRDEHGSGSAVTSVLRPATEAPPSQAAAVKVHLIAPRSFNDAQQIADRFKNSIPVIINLQSAEPELSKRLIDFGSGLTYALDGGMQRIAEKVFLLTPQNVEVSAEDRARLVEQGFFHPA
jgi:cell division inhibitor SepF